jgi:hypothetical protein
MDTMSQQMFRYNKSHQAHKLSSKDPCHTLSKNMQRSLRSSWLIIKYSHKIFGSSYSSVDGDKRLCTPNPNQILGIQMLNHSRGYEFDDDHEGDKVVPDERR